MLYAFWRIDAHGRPDPASADPWGDPCPFDALGHDPAAGPYLTAVHPDGRLAYAGDVSHVLTAFAAEVARRAGVHLSGPPHARALAALALLAECATDAYATEAVAEWREPNPDTTRRGPLPDAVRRRVRHDAQSHGRAAAGRALARRLDFVVCAQSRRAA